MDWYYAENNQQKGPVTDEGLAALVSSGVVTPATLVWYPGMSEWKAYGTVRAAAAPGMAAPSATAFCSQCGRQYRMDEMVTLSGVLVCGSCKPTFVQQLREGTVSGANRKYAGFWIRFAAVFIDGIITSILAIIPQFVILGSALITTTDSAVTWSAAGIFAQLIGYAIQVVYEAWFLVNKGATPGKMACGLQVIRANGGQITWGLAIGRYFAKLVSAIILLIGYIMAAWDPEKRALHDRMCDTRVIRK